MLWTLFPFLLVAILVAGVLVAGSLACRVVHRSQRRLAGAGPKENFLQGSESFAMMDEPSTVRVSGPGKARMMIKINSHSL